MTSVEEMRALVFKLFFLENGNVDLFDSRQRLVDLIDSCCQA